MNAANILKPALSRGGSSYGATTYEYRMHIEKDSALDAVPARNGEQPSIAESIEIIKGISTIMRVFTRADFR